MITHLQAALGSFLGLAVGDALGTTLEFDIRRPVTELHTGMTGGGVFRLKPGQWTDDTAMALAMAAAIVKDRSFDPFHVMDNWVKWYTKGEFSCTGTCFDIGISTRAALEQYISSGASRLYIPDDNALGNAPLMRLVPVILFSRTVVEAQKLAYAQAALTHGHEAARATETFGRYLYGCIHNDQNVANALNDTLEQYRKQHRDSIRSSGYYQHTLDAAYWAVATTSSFEDAVVAAVNLGDDADTVGAVCGQLAGALYGIDAIPQRWLEPLAWREELTNLTLT